MQLTPKLARHPPARDVPRPRAQQRWIHSTCSRKKLARALADPQHKFGVLLSETEERGAQGCVATLKVKEWGFKPASIREWMFKIGSSFLRKRSAPLTFVVGPAFELVEPPDYEFLDHVVSAAFGPMLDAGAQLDPLPVANVLVQETSVFGN